MKHSKLKDDPLATMVGAQLKVGATEEEAGATEKEAGLVSKMGKIAIVLHAFSNSQTCLERNKFGFQAIKTK